MDKQRWLCIMALSFILAFSIAGASGLFPEMDKMFGTALPSVGLVIGREADEQMDSENGSLEKYLNFGNEEYMEFGRYLSGIGAIVDDYTIEGTTITAMISARDASISFSYNWGEQTAIIVYPVGTRAEKELEEAELKQSILPPAGGIMPSAEFAVNRKPNEEKKSKIGMILSWDPFNDEDYEAFSAYLASCRAELKSSSIEGGVLIAEIILNGGEFTFVYNWNAQTAYAIYPEGTMPESDGWSMLAGNGSVLPPVNSLGEELPNISVAVERRASERKVLEDGSLQEIYVDFSEEDYNAFSIYLLEKECILKDFNADDNGVLVISLSNRSGKLMTFSYDAVHHIGTVVYPADTRVEKAWTAKPTPQETKEPEISLHTANYSESQCWDIAYKYFINLRWNDPQSLTIYGHSSTYADGNYTFAIDYSVANRLGGVVRDYYWVTVDDSTGSVLLGYINDN